MKFTVGKDLRKFKTTSAMCAMHRMDKDKLFFAKIYIYISNFSNCSSFLSACENYSTTGPYNLTLTEI